MMEKLGMTRSPADDFDHPGYPRDIHFGGMCCIGCQDVLVRKGWPKRASKFRVYNAEFGIA